MAEYELATQCAQLIIRGLGETHDEGWATYEAVRGTAKLAEVSQHMRTLLRRFADDCAEIGDVEDRDEYACLARAARDSDFSARVLAAIDGDPQLLRLAEVFRNEYENRGDRLRYLLSTLG